MKMNDDSENNGEQVQPLADVYGFLALCMRYPDPSFLTDEFLDVFEELLVSFALYDQQQEISSYRKSNDKKTFLDDLQVAYTRLFINAAPHLIAPPYGSFYLDGDRTLQGKSTEKTRDFYREYGYDVADRSEPADHIRFELEFLSALLKENQFEAENTFLTTIFRPWFTQFYNKVLEDKGHPFYRVSLQLIDFFTKEDQ
jgi:TorA maturation chaperone TorD